MSPSFAMLLLYPGNVVFRPIRRLVFITTSTINAKTDNLTVRGFIINKIGSVI